MISARRMQALFFAVAAAFAPLATGCVVTPAPVTVDGYEPVYYEGYPVYYDDGGIPYYYDGGTVVYVPRTYVHYGVLLHHHQAHATAYRRWYVHGGYRSKGYHRAAPHVAPHRAPRGTPGGHRR